MANEINLADLKLFLQKETQEIIRDRPQDIDKSAWGYEEGVLLTARQAALFAHLLEFSGTIKHLTDSFDFHGKKSLFPGLIHIPAFFKEGKYHLGIPFMSGSPNPLCGETDCQPLNHMFFRGYHGEKLYKLDPKEFAKSGLSSEEFLQTVTEHQAIEKGYIIRLTQKKVDDICPICLELHYQMFGRPNLYNG